nr:T9SS type A sorting domain-containing protein [Chitinophagaceae bacterium]
MKRVFTIIVLLLAVNMNCLKAQTLVGTGQTYPTLKSAFDDINNGTITGNIVLQITSSITESALASLNASGSGSASYSSVLIYPTGAGYTISSVTNTGGLISLNGADNVIIDGRVNMLGSTPDLTLSYNSNSPASTVLFQNGARFNKVRYCNINVSPPNASNGAIKFAGNVDTSNASSRNKVHNNNLSYNSPIGGQQLVILLVNENADTIENNNFINYMFQYTVGGGGNSSAIRMINGCFNNLVKGNSFYHTGNFQPLQSINTCAIYSQAPVNLSYRANDIIDNYIGGTAPQCGGAPMTITSVNPADNISFNGIVTQGGSIPYELSNNTISNISILNNKNNGTAFTGIYHYSGNGNIHHNTIGASVGTGSIISQNSNNSSENIGIFIGQQSTMHVHDNVIGSITCTNTSPIYYSNFTGIQKSLSGGYVILEKNLIGSEVTPASIQTNSTAESWQALRGIYLTNGDSILVTENIISHLYNNHTKTDNANEGGVIGIHNTSVSSTRIKRNIIKNLSCNSASIASIVGPVTGILNASSGSNLFQEIEGNTIYNLESTNNSAANLLVKGICINFSFGNLGDYTIKNNFIHSLITNSTGSLSAIEGIAIHNASITLSNNIISLGTTSRRAYGIHEYPMLAAYTVNSFHNTIYIAGLASDFQSSAYWKAALSPFGSFKNNVFFNNKANASGVQLNHFAFITLASILPNSIDYNNYYAPNIASGGAIGRYQGTDKPTLFDWQTATTQDANSINLDPSFNLPGGTSAVNFYPNTAMPSLGIPGIPTDYFRNIRTVFWMGALESNVPLPALFKSFTVQLETENQVNLLWTTAAEYNASHFEIEKSADANTWIKIGNVAAHGNSQIEQTYQFLDRETYTGAMYYRIKQIDLDGHYTYSQVEKVLKSITNDITIYPNPCNMILNISTPANDQTSTIEIYSLDGRRVLSEQLTATNHKIDVHTLTKGTYMLRVFNSEKTFTTKFVRQ